MDFIENIKECLGELFPKEPPFKITVFGDTAVYFENVKSIIGYSSEKIILSFKKGGINVAGENLYIKKYCAGDVLICGKITAMERF